MRAGLPVPEVLYGDWSAVSGLEHGRTILAAEKRPAAVFAANEQRALGVMQAAHDRVPRIPEDLSVAGFADIDEGAPTGRRSRPCTRTSSAPTATTRPAARAETHGTTRS